MRSRTVLRVGVPVGALAAVVAACVLTSGPSKACERLHHWFVWGGVDRAPPSEAEWVTVPLEDGDSVAVIGLGVLGLIAVRMAVQAGAEKVFAVDMLPNRRQWALDHGADAVLDPAEDDVALRIHELTGGKGVDVAIELAGAYPALNTALKCVRNTGTVCSAGFYQGEAYGLHLGREWHHNRLTIVVPHGCGWGHEPRDYPRWDQKRAYDVLASLLHSGKLDVSGLITPIVGFEEGVDVFHMIRDDPNQVIKYGIRF